MRSHAWSLAGRSTVVRPSGVSRDPPMRTERSIEHVPRKALRGTAVADSPAAAAIIQCLWSGGPSSTKMIGSRAAYAPSTASRYPRALERSTVVTGRATVVPESRVSRVSRAPMAPWALTVRVDFGHEANRSRREPLCAGFRRPSIASQTHYARTEAAKRPAHADWHQATSVLEPCTEIVSSISWRMRSNACLTRAASLAWSRYTGVISGVRSRRAK